MKLSSFLPVILTATAGLLTKGVVRLVDAAESLRSNDTTTVVTTHSMVRKSSSTSNSSQRQRELFLGRLRLRDYCIQDANGQHRTVRMRPLFRSTNANSNANIVKRGKCNTCPCDHGPNLACVASTNLCVCEKGYRFNVAGDTCIDINECTESASQPVCRPGQTCTNTPGNYTCNACPCNAPNEICNNSTKTCTCKAGFELDATTGDCIDIDECSSRRVGNDGTRCGESATCTNTIGSFTCTPCPCDQCAGPADSTTCPCSAGFVRRFNATTSTTSNITNTSIIIPVSNVSNTCTDIDECAVNRNICGTSSGQTCTNAPGGYLCTGGNGGNGGGGGIFPIICLIPPFFLFCPFS